MNNKKIAVIVYHFQDKKINGGGEKIMFNLVKQLCQKELNVDLYYVETNTDNYYGTKNVFCLTSLDYYNKAKLLIKNNEYDLVITENINASGGDLTIAMGHSIAYRQNIVRNLFERIFSNSKLKKEQIKDQAVNSKNYNLVIALSEVAKKDYIEFLNISDDKVKVIYPGVEIPDHIEKSNNSVYTFGLSAPGFDRKGGYILLNALKYLKRQKFQFKAKIICPTHKANKLINLSLWMFGIKDNVEFLELQEDMTSFYKSIDCLVLPSKEESFGMVATEAMANKKLVIVSSRCGASDIIDDGVNGFVFDINGNAGKKLAAKMRIILENKINLDEIIKNGHETAKRLSWDNFCDCVLKKVDSKK